MKKTILWFLIYILLISINTNTLASNYDDHWANYAIQYLMNKKVITGDGGGVRPDDEINRAEFSKIINANFGYSEMDDMPFADINQNDWYYKDMLIAKKAGYLKGNVDSLVNPKGLLSRAEASVIAARMIGGNKSESNIFSDNTQIPSWAQDAVNTLAQLKLLTGYGDGSFKPNHSITRAEAFALIVRIEDYMIKQSGGAKSNDNQNIYASSVMGSSKPKTGGGGGSSSSSSDSKPVIIRVNMDNFEVLWENYTNAAAYIVRLQRTTNNNNDYVEISSYTNSLNIKDEINSLMNKDKQPEENFKVFVKAMLTSQKETVFSEGVSFTVVNPSALLPSDIQCRQTIGMDGSEILSLVWTKDNSVSVYDISMDYEDGQGFRKVNYTMQGNLCIYQFTQDEINQFKEKHKIKMQALNDDENILDSLVMTKELDFPLYGGEEQNYKLIYNQRHFKNIRNNPGAMYKLKNNITLSDYTPFEFSGSLEGDNESELKSLDININMPSLDYVGVFSYLTGSVKIKNIKTTGNVVGRNYVGALAGQTSKVSAMIASGSSITNCINEAKVSGTSQIGGFIGRVFDNGSANLKVSKLINYGTISGTSNIVGGIFGISNCSVSVLANYGNVSGNSLIGGVVGWCYSTLTSCFNVGNVSATIWAGGIVGQMSAPVMQDCFNAGDISGGPCGGIFAYSSVDTTVSHCYNAGGVIKGSPIYSQMAEGKTVVAVECYYLSEALENDGFNGTEPLNSAQMKTLSSFVGFSESIWMIGGNIKYKYPQLVKNLYKIPPTQLSCNITNIYFDGTDVIVSFDGDSNALKYTCKVYQDSNIIYETSLIQQQKILIASNLFAYGQSYVFEITAVGDNENYTSTSVIIDYVHTHRKIAKPVISSAISWDENAEETYTINWERVADANLIGYGVELYSENNTEIIYSVSNQIETQFAIPSDKVTLGGKYNVYVTSNSSIPEENSVKASITVDTKYAGGRGTADAPYIIKNGRQFKNIANALSAYYLLDNDIVLTDYKPIVNFSGKLIGSDDVNLKSITMNIAAEPSNNIGLFSTISGAAEIKNVLLKGSVDVGIDPFEYIGGFVGKAEGSGTKIENCINEAKIRGKRFVSGIVGGGYSTITRCINKGDITGSYCVAGIIGYHIGGAVSYCANLGNVTGDKGLTTSSSSVGGIIGLSNIAVARTISNSYNIGTIKADWNIGGIIGSVTAGNMTIINCFNAGKLTAYSARGILGTESNLNKCVVTITNCYDIGVDLNITSNQKPIAFSNTGVTITNCYYLSDYLKDDTIENTTPKTSEELKQIAPLLGSAFKTSESAEYVYPVITD